LRAEERLPLKTNAFISGMPLIVLVKWPTLLFFCMQACASGSEPSTSLVNQCPPAVTTSLGRSTSLLARSYGFCCCDSVRMVGLMQSSRELM
jgi:hypothetical protein